jgi:Holliday junction resolvase RusA-like endonuclease
MTDYEFFIPGQPVAKGRPRFNSFQKRAYTPDKTANYERRVRSIIQAMLLQAGRREPYQGSVGITFTFYMARPNSHTKKQRLAYDHLTRPDLDNLEKAIMDAMNGIVYKDDSQVCRKKSEKRYGPDGAIGARVEVGMW